MLGVPSHAAFAAEMLLDEQEELCEYLVGACVAGAPLRPSEVDGVAHFIDHSEQDRLHQLCAEVVSGLAGLLLHVAECRPEELHLRFGQAEHGVAAREDEERRKLPRSRSFMLS